MKNQFTAMMSMEMCMLLCMCMRRCADFSMGFQING